MSLYIFSLVYKGNRNEDLLFLFFAFIRADGEGRRKVQEERAKRVLSRRMSHVPHDNDARVVDRSVVSVRVNKAGEK